MTPAELRTRLPELPSGDDSVYVTRISEADWLLALWLGYPRTDAGTYTLEQETYTLYPGPPDPYDPRLLRLGIRPVISVTSAHDSSDWEYDSADAIASGDMVLDAADGLLYLKPGNASRAAWSTGARSRKVVVEAGVATAGVDLQAIVAAQVRHLLALQRAQSIVSASQQGQSVSRDRVTDRMIAPVARTALAPYRLWEVGCG